GGDDGLSLPGRSTVGIGTLGNDLVWYYVVLTVLAAVLYGLHRLVHSRFGRVIAAIRENEARAEAIGFPVYRYKLACFVIAGGVGGLAGALIANRSSYVSPSLLHWIQSGTLMIMVILGGVGTLWGGVIGAAVTLEIVRGEVHALIGPNGAGKTTLIGQISGVLATDSGRILFNGADITRLSAHARVAAGLARSYQITSIFRRYSVLENLALAVQ